MDFEIGAVLPRQLPAAEDQEQPDRGNHQKCLASRLVSLKQQPHQSTFAYDAAGHASACNPVAASLNCAYLGLVERDIVYEFGHSQLVMAGPQRMTQLQSSEIASLLLIAWQGGILESQDRQHLRK